MKKINIKIKILVFVLFSIISISNANADCGCVGSTVTIPFYGNWQGTNTWFYSITYIIGNGGNVCFVSSIANSSIYGGDYPLIEVLRSLFLSNPLITTIDVPISCYSSTGGAPLTTDGPGQISTVVLKICSPGCCRVNYNDLNTMFGGSPEACPAGCIAWCNY
jgi:hypothetical protein